MSTADKKLIGNEGTVGKQIGKLKVLYKNQFFTQGSEVLNLNKKPGIIVIILIK